MDLTIEDYFHDFRNRLLAEQSIRKDFQRSTFVGLICDELQETGFINEFEHCHYHNRKNGRADAFYFDDDKGALDLHIADFNNLDTLQPLNKSGTDALFKKARRFYIACRDRSIHEGLDESTPEYRLARVIHERRDVIRQVRFVLISERRLNIRTRSYASHDLGGVKAMYTIWDMTRLHRQYTSRGGQEPVKVDFLQMFKKGLPCLRANVGVTALQSYLAVMSGEVLAGIYDRYEARLLEQNVRCFLQARGKVNRGIRDTILHKPHMFFAYNNGLTATAQEVFTRDSSYGSEITLIKGLQIVNGGQTAASLYHASRHKEAPDLSQVFVQMKLSVITEEEEEENEDFVSNIALYANTQNKVNTADLRSNHPFHARIEEFSRRIWAPAKEGEIYETKWFYERSRGQYLDRQAKLTAAEKKRFRLEYPPKQKFTKTDLAKFENVWDEAPHWVNLGAQKNFLQYADRICEEWIQKEQQFDESYYHRAVARAIVFKATEQLVSSQDWYSGGYRANIVAYTLSAVARLSRDASKELDFERIWKDQNLDPLFLNQLAIVARMAYDVLYLSSRPVQNCSEWAKREEFWDHVKQRLPGVRQRLTPDFWSYFVSAEH